MNRGSRGTITAVVVAAIVLGVVAVWAYVSRDVLVAWIQFFLSTQELGRLLVGLALIVAALVELLVAMILRQRATAFEQERTALSDLNRRQVELLDREIFTTLGEAKVLIEQWRREYNQTRPHSSLRYRPPAPEAILNIITR